jgi:translation elongation factor EF-1alpha
MGEAIVGEVTDYFAKVGVAGIRVTAGFLSVGDTIRVKGHTTDLTQMVESMQIEHQGVPRADVGQVIGVRMKDRVRRGDAVLKLTP